jgi:transposase
VQKRVVEAIRGGNYVETAAACAGIGRGTLEDWMQRGRLEGTGIYAEFAHAVEMARAKAHKDTVAIIRKASFDSWQAAAWWLERSFPDLWGRRDRVEHTGPHGGPIQTIDLTKLSTAELEAWHALYVKASGQLALPE